MGIRIERRKSLYNHWQEYYIELDGKRMSRIAANQNLELRLASSPCRLTIKKEFQRGTVIDVAEGDHLMVKRNKWSYLMQIFYVINIALLIPTLNYLFEPSTSLSANTKIMIWIASWIIYLILYITVPTISIRKKENL